MHVCWLVSIKLDQPASRGPVKQVRGQGCRADGGAMMVLKGSVNVCALVNLESAVVCLR